MQLAVWAIFSRKRVTGVQVRAFQYQQQGIKGVQVAGVINYAKKLRVYDRPDQYCNSSEGTVSAWSILCEGYNPAPVFGPMNYRAVNLPLKQVMHNS